MTKPDPGQFTIIALDLGTTTGWATVVPPPVSPALISGTISFKPKRFEGGGMRYLRFRQWLVELFDSTLNPVVFFEEVRRHAGTDAAHVYGGFMAVLTAFCEARSIAYEGIPVGTIKKHATGKGNANKAAMLAAAQARGWHPEDDNEADAQWLADWALSERFGGGQAAINADRINRKARP